VIFYSYVGLPEGSSDNSHRAKQLCQPINKLSVAQMGLYEIEYPKTRG
jgi:hypothetical protein